MKKIFVVGPSTHYACWIDDSELVEDISKADIVLFTGGEDVNPELYGCEVHPSTYFNQARDSFEIEMFNKVRPDQFVIGICRGLQLINVLYGGLLVQNVYNHAIYGTHPMSNGSKIFEITSLHHQMVYPFNIPSKYYDILFWSTERSYSYEGDKIDYHYFISNGEPEVVLYHDSSKPLCLGIQGHPEMMSRKSETVKMLNKLVDKYAKKS